MRDSLVLCLRGLDSCVVEGIISLVVMITMRSNENVAVFAETDM